MPKPVKTIEKRRFFDDFRKQEGQKNMPSWLLGGLIVILKAILQVMGAIFWHKAAKSQHDPFLGPSWAHLGPILEHLGAKVGLRWVFLGASWAVWRHFGALREAPGRHLEAKVGLGSIDLELTCGKKVSCQNL